MRNGRKLVAVSAGLVSAGVYAGLIAYDAATEILVILGSGIGIAFATSFLLATTRAGPLAGPMLVLFGYVAVLAWLAIWAQSCPDCNAGREWQRHDAGIALALYYGFVFLMALGASVAGATLGALTKRLSSRAGPSG
jgi:hypothetical protein